MQRARFDFHGNTKNIIYYIPDRAVYTTVNIGLCDNFSPSHKALYHHFRFNIVQAGAAVEVEEGEELVQLDKVKKRQVGQPMYIISRKHGVDDAEREC